MGWSLFLIKLQACNFIRKKLKHKCFPVKFTKFLRTPFFTEHLRLLLLNFRLWLNYFFIIDGDFNIWGTKYFAEAEIAILKYFGKLTRKHPWWNPLIVNFQLKKYNATVFFCKFFEYFHDSFSTEHLRAAASNFQFALDLQNGFGLLIETWLDNIARHCRDAE